MEDQQTAIYNQLLASRREVDSLRKQIDSFRRLLGVSQLKDITLDEILERFVRTTRHQTRIDEIRRAFDEGARQMAHRIAPGERLPCLEHLPERP